MLILIDIFSLWHLLDTQDYDVFREWESGRESLFVGKAAWCSFCLSQRIGKFAVTYTTAAVI